MFVSESQMKESDGVWIESTNMGVGYQLVGALTRLGRRVCTRDSDEQKGSFRVPKLQPKALVGACQSAVFTLGDGQELVRGERSKESDWQKLRERSSEFRKMQPTGTLIWLVSQAEDPSRIKQEHHEARVSWTLACHRSFGFKDEFLMDGAMKLFETQSPVLDQRSCEFSAASWSYLGDLASLVVSAILQPPRGLIHSAPLVSVQAGESWVKAFLNSFPIRQPNLLERLANRLSSPALQEFFSGQALESHFEVATAHFPTRATSLSRIFESSRISWDRHPDLRSHFPPGRAL